MERRWDSIYEDQYVHPRWLYETTYSLDITIRIFEPDSDYKAPQQEKKQTKAMTKKKPPSTPAMERRLKLGLWK